MERDYLDTTEPDEYEQITKLFMGKTIAGVRFKTDYWPDIELSFTDGTKVRLDGQYYEGSGINVHPG
jgi:hypothetical protein